MNHRRTYRARRRLDAQHRAPLSPPNTTHVGALASAKLLIVVESPAKAHTIQEYLRAEGDTRVIATMGHVRDLPKHNLGVEVTRGFAPHFVILPEREDVVKRLQQAAQHAQKIVIASDPDREGEAIAWHVAELIRPHTRAPIVRAEFHEITPKAVALALQRPRAIDMRLVRAQHARRILDRLIGYCISRWLWQAGDIASQAQAETRAAQKSMSPTALSAGRVQTAALRLIVEREQAIRAFKPQPYWLLFGVFVSSQHPDSPFKAKLMRLNDKPPRFSSDQEAQEIANKLSTLRYFIDAVREEIVKRAPPPPFTTSAFQQSAARVLHISPEEAMRIAQQLYEGVLVDGRRIGLITYMRTDSVRVSDEALQEVQRWLLEHFGDAYALPRPRQFRVARSAQDAHEAIRPTSVFRTPDYLATHADISPRMLSVYDLIWRRFLASQMPEAQFRLIHVDVVSSPEPALQAMFQARAKVLIFDGFLRIYPQLINESEQMRQEERDDTSADETQVAPDWLDWLPSLERGMSVVCHGVTSDKRYTQPPPRYSEASLVKALERHGIGRPSTYAAILGKLKERGYVRLNQRSLIPTPLGEHTLQLLVAYFPEFFSLDFTRNVEEHLDAIAEGKASPESLLSSTYAAIQRVLEHSQRESTKSHPD